MYMNRIININVDNKLEYSLHHEVSNQSRRDYWNSSVVTSSFKSHGDWRKWYLADVNKPAF